MPSFREIPESLIWDMGERMLQADITALGEAVVVEQASVMEMKVDRRVFHVGSDLTSRGGNTTELLENIPSVAVDIDGNITLRGSSGVQILIDGRPSSLAGGARVRRFWNPSPPVRWSGWSSSPTPVRALTPTAPRAS